MFSLAVGGALLSGCSQLLTGTNDTRGDADVLDKVRSLDLLPRFPREQTGRQDATASDRREAGVYPGVTIEPPPTDASTASGGEGFDLNFENAPIANVAKVILGDIMGVGYTIDPRVQGTVTLSSGRPVPKSDMLYVLES